MTVNGVPQTEISWYFKIFQSIISKLIKKYKIHKIVNGLGGQGLKN